MARRTRTLAAIALCLTLASGLAWPAIHRHLRAAAVLAAAVGIADPTGITPQVMRPVREQDRTLQLPGGALRARQTAPLEGPVPTVLLLHGVHPEGIDEVRFRRFARALAAAGLRVVAPELPSLTQHRVSPRDIETIRQCADTVADRGPVGVIAISFAAGLALLAARGNDHRIGFVLSVGGHHDLSRLARYYAGQQIAGPDGQLATTRPHPYGVAVLMASLLGPDATPSSEGLLRAAAAHRAELDAISPTGKLSDLGAPAFFVHGLHDPVIPSTETRWLIKDTPATRLRTAVISPLLRHTELPDTPGLRDGWALVRLIADVVGEAESLADDE